MLPISSWRCERSKKIRLARALFIFIQQSFFAQNSLEFILTYWIIRITCGFLSTLSKTHNDTIRLNKKFGFRYFRNISRNECSDRVAEKKTNGEIKVSEHFIQ